MTPVRRSPTGPVSLGLILAPLNATMLVVALPDIREHFGLSYGHVTWLTSIYLAAMLLAQPFGGRLGDRFGNVRVFRHGLWALAALSLACALAPTFGALLVLRTAQALAGAAVIPNGLAVLRRSLPARELGKALGIAGAAIGSAAVIGPVLASLLLLVGEWRLVFLASVPLGLLAAARGGAISEAEEPADAGHAGQAIPFFNRDLLGSRAFLAASLFGFLSNAILYMVLLAVPFFVTQVHGQSSAMAGGLLGVMSLRLGGKRIMWDAMNMKATNLAAADEIIHETRRNGWELA